MDFVFLDRTGSRGGGGGEGAAILLRNTSVTSPALLRSADRAEVRFEASKEGIMLEGLVLSRAKTTPS